MASLTLIIPICPWGFIFQLKMAATWINPVVNTELKLDKSEQGSMLHCRPSATLVINWLHPSVPVLCDPRRKLVHTYLGSCSWAQRPQYYVHVQTHSMSFLITLLACIFHLIKGCKTRVVLCHKFQVPTILWTITKKSIIINSLNHNSSKIHCTSNHSMSLHCIFLMLMEQSWKY